MDAQKKRKNSSFFLNNGQKITNKFFTLFLYQVLYKLSIDYSDNPKIIQQDCNYKFNVLIFNMLTFLKYISMICQILTMTILLRTDEANLNKLNIGLSKQLD